MIDKLSDQEKSLLLALCMGWNTEPMFNENGIDRWLFQPPDSERLYSSFYHPENMALAWRVLNWACQSETFAYEHRQWCAVPFTATDVFAIVDTLGLDHQWEYSPLDHWWPIQELLYLEPAAAQRAWLDKILSLAAEAGIVQLEAFGGAIVAAGDGR